MADLAEGFTVKWKTGRRSTVAIVAKVFRFESSQMLAQGWTLRELVGRTLVPDHFTDLHFKRLRMNKGLLIDGLKLSSGRTNLLLIFDGSDSSRNR